MNLTNLDVLGLASLPDSALIPRLANRVLKRREKTLFTMDEARDTVRSLGFKHGKITKTAKALYDEVARQRPIRESRSAQQLLAWYRTEKQQATKRLLNSGPQGDRRRRLKAKKRSMAETIFGDFIRESFREDILTILELVTGPTTFHVQFLDVGSRPVISCIASVLADHKTVNLLLYKVPGTNGKIKGVVTRASDVKSAWAEQVPPEALAFAEEGFTFKTDYENQTLVATVPDGDDAITAAWTGQIK